MTALPLDVHYYGSATVGLGLSGRGWQTIGQSAGVGPFEPVEAHCTFFLPTATGDPQPVNVGWRWLPDGRACAFRVGYAGNDDMGRAGNFLATNLIAAPDTLDAIDHDIAGLLRWVSDENPERYRHPAPGEYAPPFTGPSNGFPYCCDQIYDSLGWNPARVFEVSATERQRLADLPPLAVPVAAVRAVRAKADERLPQEWRRLQVLGLGDAVRALLRALLGRPAHRRPVIAVGLGDGDDGAATERAVVDFLFAVLPYHLRKELTFATYDSWGKGTLPSRRLTFTTRFNTESVLPAAADGSDGWLVRGNGPSLLPPVSPTAEFYLAAIRDGRWDDLLRVRERASLYDFAVTADWLPDVRQMDHWRGTADISPSDFDNFYRAAHTVRPSAAGLLADAHRFAAAAITGRTTTSPVNFARAYLTGLARVGGAIPPAERAAETARVAADIADLFDWCVRDLSASDASDEAARKEIQKDAGEAVAFLLRQVADDPALAAFRAAALDGCTAKLESRLAKPDRNDFSRCAKLWPAVRAVSDRGFVARAAQALAAFVRRVIEKADDKTRAALRKHAPEFIAPVLAHQDIPSLSALGDRLALLARLHDGSAPALPDFVREARKLGTLTDATLADATAQDPPDFLLDHYEAWAGLSDRTAATAALRERLESPALLAAWWRRTPTADAWPHTNTAIQLLRDYAGVKQNRRRAALAAEFLATPGAVGEPLGRVEPGFPPVLVVQSATAHFLLVRRLAESAAETDSLKTSGNYLRAQACDHLAAVFAWLLNAGASGEQLREWQALHECAAACARLATEPDKRAALVEWLAEVARRRGVVPPLAGDPFLAEWQHALRAAPDPAIETDEEADWLADLLERALAGATAPRADATARLLVARPHLLGARRGAFLRFVYTQTSDGQAAWDAVGERFAADIAEATNGTLAGWVKEWTDDRGGRRPLLDELRRWKVLKPLGLRIVANADRERLRALARLELCRELSEPATTAYLDATERDIRATVADALRADRAGPPPVSALLREASAVSWYRANLPAELVADYWTAVGEGLAHLTHDQLDDLPTDALFDIAEGLSSSADAWNRLLEPLTRPLASVADGTGAGPTCGLTDVFLALAEPHFRPPVGRGGELDPHDPNAARARARPLTDVFHDARFRPHFAPGGAGTERAFQLLAELPPGAAAHAGGWDADTFAHVAGRVRLIAALRPDAGIRAYLGGVCGRWGTSGGTVRPQLCSFALIGFLTANGCKTESVAAQAAVAGGEDFWKGFVEHGPKNLMPVLSIAEQFLPNAGVKARDATAAIKRLRER